MQAQIEDAAFHYTEGVESGDRVIVGVNRFVEDDAEDVELHRVDPEGERLQRERTAKVRAERDSSRAGDALAEVRSVAQTTENLLPPMREALRARCTIGEICGELRELWGTHDSRRR